MTIVLAIAASGGQWSVARWLDRLTKAIPSHPARDIADPALDPGTVRYAAVWKPELGALARFPKLEAIFNLGAGVDALLADPALPVGVPVYRATSPDLTGRMTEYVTLHVLAALRNQRKLAIDQRNGIWRPSDQPPARAVRVGILGFGTLGRDAADVLLRLGFQVAGWSRAPHPMAGVDVFAGNGGLAPFLARTDVLVSLLPLTPETRGMLNYALFGGLARDGVLGSPQLINAGRGGLQVEADILRALDDGTLGGATLDVFETEPLPQSSPLWAHPKVTITPHNAADSDPDLLAVDVAAAIRLLEAGQQPPGLIDRARGY